MAFDWMSPKQKEDYDVACLLIGGIKTPKDFYAVMRELDKYDFDAVACAREATRCYNSAQYDN